MSGRDLAAERELLTDAGGSLYAEAAAARLNEADCTFGTSFAWTARSVLWDKIAEQAIDVGAYSALALRRAELDGMPPRQLARLRGLLGAVAKHGAQAEALAGEARRLANSAEGAA